jgi:hypothetical protein
LLSYVLLLLLVVVVCRWRGSDLAVSRSLFVSFSNENNPGGGSVEAQRLERRPRLRATTW